MPKNKFDILHQDSGFYSKNHSTLFWEHRKWTMLLFMLSSDLFCLLFSAILALILWHQIRSDLLLIQYENILFPAAGGFMLVYFLMGLYPGLGIGPVEELRRLTIGSCLTVLGLAALSFYLGNTGILWSRAILGLSWLFITISMPLSRKIFRRLALRWNLWGMPVAIMGDRDNAIAIYNKLKQHPLSGFWPVICIAIDSIQNVLPETRSDSSPDLFKGIDIAIITFGQISLDHAKNILLSSKSHRFQRIIIMLNEQRIGPLWMTPLHLVEYLGLEVTHNLLNPLQKTAKRLSDLILILLSIPFWVPFTLLLASLIKLDSPGPIFYSQKRIGYNGKEIRIWKFRTMVYNAEQELPTFLEQQPALKTEWQQNFKLKNDPRITRVGSFLRRTSLDEFPQIWNILRGEMSVVGPRPIVQDEIQLYGKEFSIYKQVLPGLTGMWQISGRNDIPYEERVNLDVYYVQNWSIWLDVHIMIHTVLTVLQGRGAY